MKLLGNKPRVLLLICAIASPIFLAFLIARFAVNVPFLDEWFTPASIFSKIHDSGQISFSDLIEQHNESRLFFPKLIFLLSAYLTHWDTRHEMAIIFLMACLIATNLLYIAAKTITVEKTSKQARLLLFMALSNMLIFSPAQYENWLWGIQIVVFIPILCLTTGISVWYSNIRDVWKVVFVVSLSTVSTFSYANGLLCWFLLPLTAIFLGKWNILKRHVKLIVFWGVACISNLTLYFWNYVKPTNHPSFFESLFHPLKALNYFFAFLGSSLGGGSLILSSMVGFAVMLIAGILGVVFSIRWGSKGLRYRAAGWITLLVYSLASAVITTSGRMGFGVEQAMESRYTTFSLYGIIGLMGLVMILSDEISWHSDMDSAIVVSQSTSIIIFSSNNKEQNRIVVPPSWSYEFAFKRITRDLPLFLAILLIVLNISVQNTYINAMDMKHRERLYAKACLIHADFVEDNCMTQSLANPLNIFKRNLTATRALGILKQEDFAQNAQVVNAASGFYDYGWIDSMKPTSGDNLVASGWAMLENPERSADAVLLSYQDDQGENRVFTVAPVKFDRPDVSNVKQNSAYTRSGWAVQFSRKSLPSRKVEIKAWAYDVKTKNSYPLNGVHTLN
jgi:hypothetical protein